MDRGRQVTRTTDPFDMLGGLGDFGGFGASIFGRNPFDDPFFTRPFGATFAHPGVSGGSSLASKGPVIQELHSEDEEEGEQSEDKGGREPFVHHPDDDEVNDEDSEDSDQKIDQSGMQRTQAQTLKFHSRKVTYGGIDGAYYTSSTSREMGNDGVLIEECKEADKTTGRATHKISRGIHDKGHSVTRKLNSDGNVETLQTLHNLNEDELKSFEDAWKGWEGLQARADPFSTSWDTGSSRNVSGQMSNWGGWLSPPAGQSINESGGRRPKKVVRINIE